MSDNLAVRNPRDLKIIGATQDEIMNLPLKDRLIQLIADDVHVISSLQMLDSGLIGYTKTVNTTPTLLITAQKQKRGLWLLNPSLVVGTMAKGTLLASAVQTTNGNTQASPLGVANYRDVHLFLNVTAVGGTLPTLDIFTQAPDPVSGNWTDVQNIWTAITGTGTYYVNIGNLGVTDSLAIRWVLGGTLPSFTFSVGYVVKEGLPGTGTGVGKGIYFGTISNINTGAGFPLLEGQKEKVYLREDTELWGVAAATTTLNIFELSRINLGVE